MQSLFVCLLHLLVVFINCLPINSEKELYIGIYRDGTLQNNSATPRCGSGEKLSLKSYHYTTKTCKYGGSVCSRISHPFSMEATMFLHNMCSYKEACANLSFPAELDLQKYNPDGVLIKYDCLDRSEQFCDICNQTETVFKGKINLIAGENARNFSQCKCLLGSNNRSVISVTLKDLRLKTYDKFQSRCSDAVLEINKTKIICDQNRTDLGCAFNEPLVPPMAGAAIIFTPKDAVSNFEMVWLILNAKGSASMVCEGEQKQSKSASETTSISEKEVPSNQSAGKNGETDSKLPGSVYTIIIGIIVLMCVMSITIILIYIKKRRKKTHDNMPQKGCSKEELLDDTTYDVCTKFGRIAAPTCRNDTYDHLPQMHVEMAS